MFLNPVSVVSATSLRRRTERLAGVAEPRRLSVELQMPRQPVSTGAPVSFSVVVSWGEHRVVADIRVSIMGPKRSNVHEYARKTSSFGIANESWTVPEDAILGTYAIEVIATKRGYLAGQTSANFEVI
jgi:hypothetical protein